MFNVQEMLKNCPNFKLQDLNYGNICSPYDFGAWAVAYLLNNIDNQYAMQELFWPSINALGYYPAFESIFGLKFDFCIAGSISGEYSVEYIIAVASEFSII